MNNKEFISKLASATKNTADETQKIATSVIREMGKTLEQGTAISVFGFGTFEVKKRMERVIVHPGTGKRMLVPPKLVLNFKPTPIVKQKIKKGVENNG
ncbi:MAG: HU family DNA-binding protein [Prevotella sp.]|nr:HU family DNA-binding protein [Prevotella sp.]